MDIEYVPTGEHVRFCFVSAVDDIALYYGAADLEQEDQLSPLVVIPKKTRRGSKCKYLFPFTRL